MGRQYNITEEIVKIKFTNKTGFLDFVRIEIQYKDSVITHCYAYIDSEKVFSFIPLRNTHKRIVIIKVMKNILERF